IEGTEQVGAVRASLWIGDDGAFAFEPVLQEVVLVRRPIVGVGGTFFDDDLEQPAQRLVVPVVSQDQLDRRAILELSVDGELHSLIKLSRSSRHRHSSSDSPGSRFPPGNSQSPPKWTSALRLVSR